MLSNNLPAFLYFGELIEHGPTETIFTEPNDPSTKAYIEGAFGYEVSRTYLALREVRDAFRGKP